MESKMRSLETDESDEPRDTLVPEEHIYAILSWFLEEIYYGGGMTVIDLDCHIGDSLRTTLYPRSVVEYWLHRSGVDKWQPKPSSMIVATYRHVTQLRLVA